MSVTVAKLARSGPHSRDDVIQVDLPLLTTPPTILDWKIGPRAIEDEAFPFEELSNIAQIESWRKEINRPLSHIHKWWAQRLGTVFRAIVLASFAPRGSDLLTLFYQPVRIPDAIILDPFMGSGTTIGESLKLGARAIGRDINPVAYFLVRNAMAVHDRQAIRRAFAEIKQDVAERIRPFYQCQLADGGTAEVLYFFWVMQVPCPACAEVVDLFPSRVFAKHAYPKRFPEAQSVCPRCGQVNTISHDDQTATCATCYLVFNPQVGPAQGQKARCPHCDHVFLIAKVVKASGHVPSHRLYAKLVLMPDGKKSYQAATPHDHNIYQDAARELKSRSDAYPIVSIEAGYNTNQILRYNYRHWHELFNDRQLLCLSILTERINQLRDPLVRGLFTCLLSGTLEFNNMFASYKGEGTGAVRPMFAHHILKPERMPLEANLWGTPKSSGSFSTLFSGRLRRALDYADEPFEVRSIERNGRQAGEKVFGLSEPIGFSIADTFQEMALGKRVYLSCGDSSATDLPAQSVDAVITDPPFFDNVHYSQLADFFHVWQRFMLGCNDYRVASTTRSSAEVQHQDASAFTRRLGSVLTEAHRVLKDEGLLVFTYHHSRAEGWRSVLEAVMRAGFGITTVHPIKSEMSVAMPKSQTKEPIDLDIIIVCRKRSQLRTSALNDNLWETVAPAAEIQISRLRSSGRQLSRNDVRVIIMAQVIRRLSEFQMTEDALSCLAAIRDAVEDRIDVIHVINQAKVT